MSTTRASEAKRYEVRQVPAYEADGAPQYQVFSMDMRAVEMPESDRYASEEEAQEALERMKAAAEALDAAMDAGSDDEKPDEAPDAEADEAMDGEKSEGEDDEEAAKEVRATASGNLYPRDLTGKRWEIVVVQEGLSANRFNYLASTLERDYHVFEGARIRVTWNGLDHHDDVGFVRGVHTRVVEGRKAICGVAEIEEPEAQKRLLKQFREGEPLEFSIDAQVRAIESGSVKDVTRFVSATEVTIVRKGAAGGRALRAVAGSGGGAADSKEGEAMSATEVNAKAKEAADRALRAAEQLEHRVKVAESRAVLAQKLAEAKLPEPARDRVRESLDGRILTDADIDAAVKKEREYLARVTAGAQVTGCGAPHVQVGAEPKDRVLAGLQGFFSYRDQEVRTREGKPTGVKVARFKSLHEAVEEWHGHRMLKSEGFRMICGGRPLFDRAREAGLRVGRRRYDDVEREYRARESVLTTTFANALVDTINKRMLEGFTLDDRIRQLKLLCGRNWGTSIADFRAQTRYKVGGYGNLPTVAQRGTYNPLTSPTDEKGTITLAKKGGTEDITLETYANDDQNVVARIPDELRLAALETLYQEVFNLFANNSNAIDGSAVFRTGNKTSSAFSKATLNTARQAMRSQTRAQTSSQTLGRINTPKIWWGPNELEEDAEVLAGSRAVVGATNQAATEEPNIHRGLMVEVVDYWTDAADCLVSADPMTCDTVEIGFFEGREEPELQVQDAPNQGAPFDIDSVKFKIRFIYAYGVLDHRPFYGFSRA